MTTNLPAYLQNSSGKKLNEVALLGIGSALPPHISIRGNTFTLVDASGAEQTAGPQLDVNICDISNVMCKQYYSEKWTPDSKEPPVCWSANGIAPSREALEPQHPTCVGCRHNVRGSAVSALSGASIKACRDEKWLAILIPQIPQVRFQLRLTPGSFKTWQAYVKTAEGSQTEISDVLTRLSFQPGVNGVLNFAAVNYIDENTAKVRNAGYAEKAFDILVGRTDKPIAALAAPVGYAPAASPPATPHPQQPAPFDAPAAARFAGAGFQAPQTGFAQPATASAPIQPTETAPRRRRRTAAEIAADNAQGQPAPAPQTAPIAPFRPQATAPAAPANPGFMAQPAAQPAAQFGMSPGVAPNPELSQALDGLFGKK